MSASRIRMTGLALASAFFVLGGVQAQTGDTASGPPQPLGTPAPVDNTAQQEPAAALPVEPAQSGVVVSTLGNVDGTAVGVLDDTNGSLGADMWSGAPRGELESELARIPVVTTDPVIRDLARRILLTPAESPVGPGKRALITIRLERLLDAGFLDEAGAIAAKAVLPNDMDFARVQAEALLYAQRDADICTEKTSARLTNAEPFWLQLRAYCYEASGDAAAADLTRSVMTAEGNNDPILDATLNGDAKAVLAADVTRPTAVDIYLLRKAGGTVTAELAAPLGTPADLIAARDAHNPPAERLQAAERIAQTGALSADELRSIADAQGAVQDGDTSALAQQIAFRRKVALETNPGVRLPLVQQADAVASQFHVFAALQSDLIAATPADPRHGRASLIAARALLSDGKPDAAAAWIGPPDSRESAQAGIALDLIASTPDRDTRAQDDVAWLVAHAAQDPDTQASAALSLGLLEALGRPLAPDAAAAAAASQQFAGARPSGDDLGHIDAAVAQPDRRGEAALLVIDAVGARGPARFAPDAIVQLVATLAKIGLDKDAHALAAEALLFGPPRQPNPPPPPPAAATAP